MGSADFCSFSSSRYCPSLTFRPVKLSCCITLIVLLHNSGFEELMGDVYIENEISEMPLAVDIVELHFCIGQPGISSTEKLQGSSDDNGWLPRTPGMPGVEDGTAGFLELLAGISLFLYIPIGCMSCSILREWGAHTLPSSFVYLLIPGLFSNHCPLYFVRTKKFFSKMGLACHIAIIHSEAFVEHNASELKQYIEELYWGSGKRVMPLGHSKGGTKLLV
ncbi:uncharacterized protein Pyn_36088 [Prunus yedoensis var. nudiflora]|uniref:Uncharacterized protein n=1 Tax=Prunus yedoensis var. nudiflora TaxID=2094558 RepID=A0A314U6F4_PRUYE|nr:uncharacterized protein Pyn_36088 [Prunus yedoensis var. nudiflora]